jgi:hypothetical protein
MKSNTNILYYTERLFYSFHGYSNCHGMPAHAKCTCDKAAEQAQEVGIKWKTKAEAKGFSRLCSYTQMYIVNFQYKDTHTGEHTRNGM